MTTTDTALEISAPMGSQEIFITRRFAASPTLLFRAFTEQALLEKWLGPSDLGLYYEHCDMRSGGSYRFINTKDGVDYAAFHGSVHEATSPERVIQTFEYEGLPERGHVALQITTFTATGDGGCEVRIHSIFCSQADRDAMIKSGMERGVREGYEKLDRIVSTL